MTRKFRALSKAALVVTLSGAAAVVASAPAFGAGYGNSVHNCYGIYWNTDWNQNCNNGGARYEGYYKSTANCTAPQIPDNKLEIYRLRLASTAMTVRTACTEFTLSRPTFGEAEPRHP